MESSKRSEIKDSMAAVAPRLNAWDPLGLIGMGAPPDEYECLIGPLVRMLYDGATPTAIAEFLDGEFVDHFGEAPKDWGSLSFATATRVWFDRLQAEAK